jgi:hypothetical protein
MPGGRTSIVSSFADSRKAIQPEGHPLTGEPVPPEPPAGPEPVAAEAFVDRPRRPPCGGARAAHRSEGEHPVHATAHANARDTE